MPETSVEQLREELRKLGYLNSGLERWFASDPLNERPFLPELLTVAAKSGVLLTPFWLLPLLLVTLLRNAPISAGDVLILAASYAVFAFVTTSLWVTGVGLLIRSRSSLLVARQRLLLGLAVVTATIFLLLLAAWWSGFDGQARILERLSFGGAALGLFVTASYVSFAAFLTLAIHEARTLPPARQRARGRWLFLFGAIVLVVFVVPVAVQEDDPEATAAQVAVAPSSRRLAIIAVDGLTSELFNSLPGAAAAFPYRTSAEFSASASPPQFWATVATGVDDSLHQVHAVQAVRFRSGGSVLQWTSRRDPLLTRVLPYVGVADRIGLPPTVRQRDYVWEIAAKRGILVVAVNWWAAGVERGALESASQEEVFRAARQVAPVDPAALAIAVDNHASSRFASSLSGRQLATVYLPALDVVINRLNIPRPRQISLSRQALQNLSRIIVAARSAGYDVLVIGSPGAGTGDAVIASSTRLAPGISLIDVAPTILDVVGFPKSAEMAGVSRLPGSTQETLPTYGRRTEEAATGADEEYFENLKSLGYIQ